MTVARAMASMGPRGTAYGSVVADTFDLALMGDLLTVLPPLADLVEWLNERFDCAEYLVRDVLLLLWQASPRLRASEDMPADYRRHHLVVVTLAGLRELDGVRAFTVHDPYAAAVVSIGLRDRLTELLEALEDAESELVLPVTRHMLRSGLDEAAEAAAEQAQKLAGWGVNPAELRRVGFSQRAELWRRFDTPRLVALLDTIGRLRPALAGAAKRALSGHDDAWDVELSGRITDVLASEWAGFATSPGLRREFYRNFAEETLLTQAYRGLAEAGQGPLVVCVDVSNSMQEPYEMTGLTREVWAKAFATALLDQAVTAQRAFAAVMFAGTGQQLVCRLPEGRPSLEPWLAMIEASLGGGTDIAGALTVALAEVATLRAAHLGEADVVLVTDGECSLTAGQLDDLASKKSSLGVTVHAAALSPSSSGGGWKFADTVEVIGDYQSDWTDALTESTLYHPFGFAASLVPAAREERSL